MMGWEYVNLKERFLTAVQHGQPDAVPIFDSLDDSHVTTLMGNVHVTTQIRVACYKRLGFDAIPVKARSFAKKLWHDDKSRLVVIDEWNRKYVYTEPRIKFYSGGVMDTQALGDYEWPNPENTERYTDIREVTRYAGEQLAVVGIVGGPFEKSVLGFGFDRFLPMLFREDKFAVDYMRRVRDYWVEVGKREQEIGVDAIMITDDYAFRNGPFFSPKLFGKLILPLLSEEIREFKKLGVPVIHHSDGDVSLLLPLLINAGIDAIQSIEPTAGMDIGEVKRVYGDKLALIGNIDSGVLLSFGTPGEVEETVKRTISECAPGGSYVLSSSNSLHYGCKLENIRAMLNAGKKYGVYR
jgi:uroporphyrinogen decarboxylase